MVGTQQWDNPRREAGSVVWDNLFICGLTTCDQRPRETKGNIMLTGKGSGAGSFVGQHSAMRGVPCVGYGADSQSPGLGNEGCTGPSSQRDNSWQSQELRVDPGTFENHGAASQ